MALVSLHIRPAAASDATALRGLLQSVDLLTDDLIAPRSHYWLAEDCGGQLYGSAGIECGARAAIMRSVAVAPGQRGGSLGARLAGCAIGFARRLGYPTLYCFSTRAGAYWQRMGFVGVPIAELASALADVPQVRRFQAIGKLQQETAWRLDL